VLAMVMQTLKVLAGLAPLVTATVAIVAIYIARAQLNLGRQNEAKRQFYGYLDSVLANHGLFKNGSFAPEVFSPDGRISMQAEALITKGLMSFEEIVLQFPDSEAWLATVESHLDMYGRNLQGYPKEAFIPELWSLMQKAIAKDEARHLTRSVVGG
jgi:hypothetical protein